MDAARFDALLRSLSARAPRRSALAALASGLLVVGSLAGRQEAEAKKKHEKKKPTLNAFGCVDVGRACRGNDTNCCSGICEGKKPKQGKRDTSICVAHHTGDCTPATTYCTAGTLNSKCGAGVVASCLTTTGNADFCGNVETFIALNRCSSCDKDADCEAIMGPGSACVIIDGGHIATANTPTNATAAATEPPASRQASRKEPRLGANSLRHPDPIAHRSAIPPQPCPRLRRAPRRRPPECPARPQRRGSQKEAQAQGQEVQVAEEEMRRQMRCRSERSAELR